MVLPDYNAIIQKLLNLLETDPTLSQKVSEFRFGHLPEQQMAASLPAVYVTVSMNPEVMRQNVGPASAITTIPAQHIITEFWIIVITAPSGTPADAQKEMYDLKDRIIHVVSRNKTLGGLCNSLDIHSQNRLTTVSGRIVESMTVMIRVSNFEGSPESIQPENTDEDTDDNTEDDTEESE